MRCIECRVLTEIEQLVACKMIRKGYEIIRTNYNVQKVGEIDIISLQKNVLVFTEVKTQTADHGWSEPRSQIYVKKSDRNVNAIQHYMDSNELDCNLRFTIGEVVLSKGKPEIKILEEALSVY